MSLDFMEYLLASLPEALVDRIEELVRWLLRLKAGNRGGDKLLLKVNDMFAYAQQALSADVMLPNLVAVITSDMIAVGL